VLRFVPYIGPWLGAALPLGLAFAAFPGNGVFFATLGMFVVIELAVSQGVEPRLLGASTGISPIAVLVAAVFWTWLWGPIGLLLSTPLTVLLVVMGKYVPQLEFLDVLLGDKPVLDPPTRVYQRLIAGDDEEALGLAQDCLKEMPLEAVYDAVLIPALAKAEVDRHRGMLDDARHAAVRQGLREIAEALGDQQRAEDSAAATAMTVREAKGTNGDEAAAEADSNELRRPSLPRGAAVHVLCLPAHDAGDEVAGLMLAQLLERRGYRVTAPSAASLASERVELVEDRETDAVVVSATPPKAALHARYLLKRLSVRNPGTEVFLGLWGNARASNDARSHDFGAARVVTSLAEAQEQLDQLAHRRTVVGVPHPAL
jgi:methylmalonyl-CoA mutase cobalamin-binding subunit